MADSNRLAVLKSLTVLLEGTALTPFAGLVPLLPATLSGLVFRGRMVFGDNDPKTMLSILEAPRPGSTSYAGAYEARSDQWNLLVQGWCPDDKENPSDPVYSLLDDVEKRLDRIVAESSNTGFPLFPSDYMLGRSITSFQMGQGVVRPPTPDVSSKSFFYLPLQVGLARISST